MPLWKRKDVKINERVAGSDAVPLQHDDEPDVPRPADAPDPDDMPDQDRTPDAGEPPTVGGDRDPNLNPDDYPNVDRGGFNFTEVS